MTEIGNACLPLVLATPGPHVAALPLLAQIEISFVDDSTIAQIHAKFLYDPTPTDVITFDHGEIFVCTETAVRQAVEYQQPPDRECALYLLHGLLHLHGHHDNDPTERIAMQHIQDAILQAVWPI